MLDAQGFLILCYSLGVVFAVAFAAYAMIQGYLLRSKIGDTEAFITARGQVNWIRIAWSFYAGAMGAWVLTGPADYASYSGMLGLCMYATAIGLPFIMIAYAGDTIRGKLPHVLSMTDFMGWRYGELAKLTVVLLILFNMGIALLSEYYTIGLIFTYFVKSVPYPMVLVVGVLTLTYTAYGGLLVSIFTDTVQGIASMAFFFVLAIYLAATFRPEELPQNQCDMIPGPNGTTQEYCYNALPCAPYGPDGPYFPCVSGTPDCSKFTELGGICPIAGYSSILTMPMSMIAATVFSEAMWQRAWASEDKKNLRLGAWVGCGAVVLMVWFAGFTGLLATWAYTPEPFTPYLIRSNDVELMLSNGTMVNATQRANYDLFLFQVLYKGKYPDINGGEYAKLVKDKIEGGYVAYPTIQNWIGVILVVMAVVMNEGAVDSIQNGMAAAITSYFEPKIKQWNLWWTRTFIILFNAAMVAVGAWFSLDNISVSINSLYLITNQCSYCFFIPVLVGMNTRLQRYLGGGSFLFSGFFAMFCLCVYGVNYYYSTYTLEKYPSGTFINPYTRKTYTVGSFSSAMRYTWLGNGFAWDFALVAACVSLGSLILSACLFALMKDVTPISKLLHKWDIDPDYPSRGITSVATHPELYQNVNHVGAKTVDADMDLKPISNGSYKQGQQNHADLSIHVPCDKSASL